MMQQQSSEDDDARSAEPRKRELPPEAVSVLKAWLMAPEHFEHPYPSPQDQQQLLLKTGIGKKQLKNWFTNARRRIWKPLMKKKQDEAEKQRAMGGAAASTLSNHRGFDHSLFAQSSLLQQHWRQGFQPRNPTSIAMPSTSGGGYASSQLTLPQRQIHDVGKISSVASLSTLPFLFDEDNSSETTGETNERNIGTIKRELGAASNPAKRRLVEQHDKIPPLTDKLHDDDALDYFHSANTTDVSASEYELPAAPQGHGSDPCGLCRRHAANVELIPCHCRFHALCLRDSLLAQDGPPVCPRCHTDTSRCSPLLAATSASLNQIDGDHGTPNDVSPDTLFPQEQELYQTSHTPPSALTEEDV